MRTTERAWFEWIEGGVERLKLVTMEEASVSRCALGRRLRLYEASESEALIAGISCA